MTYCQLQTFPSLGANQKFCAVNEEVHFLRYPTITPATAKV
jgi:hypothetical protein